jgi:plasmid stabilization system protein ParE
VSYKVSITAEVTAQILSFVSYYEGLREGQGEEVENEVEGILRSLSKFPHLYRKDFGPIHRALAKRFKLAIFYIVTNDSVNVLEVRDARQEPPDWVARGYTEN